MPAHTRRRNKRAIAVVTQLLTKRVTAGEVLFPPDLARYLGAVEDGVQVCGNDFVVVAELAVDHAAALPGYAGVGDEDVKAAVEILHDLVDDGADVGGICDVCLIRSTCN